MDEKAAAPAGQPARDEAMPHLHRAHGLVLALPFDCPELEPADPADVPDVIVRAGSVPAALDAPGFSDAMQDMTAAAYLYRSAAVGRFLAERGERIVFAPVAGCDEALLRHILLHPVLAALLRQRDLFVLHASGVVSPGGVVLLCGESGAGKSTTAAALADRGWPLQTDDISALRLDASGGIEIPAGGRHVALFEGASQALGLDTQGLRQNAWHRMKMAVPARIDDVRSARRLCRIVHLERGSGAAVQVERVTGRAKLPLLMHSVYGPYLAETVAGRVLLVSRALQDIEMLRIVRPDGDWTMDAVLAAIGGD
ncbi:hypothetical protein [Flavisphingomonas formosensis]|uniref:hypothetical protein n=1 Tax=Flavisphingomonas formosensis TaxID=861534 RepID=UPI0012FC1CAB|nr:hypothetical protein [Sphingomonas formosensis]